MNRRHQIAQAAVVGLTLVGCGLVWGVWRSAQVTETRVSRPERPPVLRGVRFFPETLDMVAGGAPHHLRVSAEDGDGFKMDVTRMARLESNQPEIVEVTEAGTLRPLAQGRALIRVRLDGRSWMVDAEVRPAPEDSRPSFRSDILPLLSKAGCSSGGCHAKPKGQNGFKLSVFSHDPAADYHQIVRAERGRRVFPAAPGNSLLLRKPSLDLKHGGGQRLEPGSEDYRRIAEWIGRGMPFLREEEPDLERIEVHPGEQLYRPGTEQLLVVRAYYSDGSIRDVTRLADFHSNDDTVARVSAEGRVRVQEITGEGVVVVRYMGLVDTVRVTVPAEPHPADLDLGSMAEANFIDAAVNARLQRLGLVPSGPCSDAEFLRRASLDTIGTLPEPETVRAFLEDPDPDKREKWIGHLLESPAYADHWAVKWADLLRPNPSRVGVKGVLLPDQWLRDAFRRNRPYDELARELLTAQGSTHRFGPAVVFRDRRTPEDLGELTSQIFLGVRMDCARCHHHPNERWSQEDFYQFAAFFGQVKRKWRGLSPPISGDAEFIYHAPGGTVKHPITEAVMEPIPPAVAPVPIGEGEDPRQALADWLVASDNPYFARAVVNRVWAEFFGVGIVDPVDDFRVSNPPSNEALLDALAADFVVHGFDLKHLMRTILESETYRRSSLPNATNAADTRNYSRAQRRRLPAEVLADMVARVTGVPDRFDGLPNPSRAIRAWNHKLSSDFLDAFGRPDSSADCPCERDNRPSVVQALHLMHSEDFQAKLTQSEGRARKLAASEMTPESIVEELYLAAYGRRPDADELRIATAAFEVEGAARDAVVEDLLWALVNSAEFVFNH